jgi:hypothetical protein
MRVLWGSMCPKDIEGCDPPESKCAACRAELSRCGEHGKETGFLALDSVWEV